MNTFEFVHLLAIIGIGLAAGLLGGLLGIGGSVVMIPAMVLVFHRAEPASQHLYQAAAMAANVAVSAPAAIQHHRAGAVRLDALRWVLAVGVVAIIAGVALSNALDGLTLRRIFAVFLLYVAATTLLRAVRRQPDHPAGEARVTPIRCGVVGGVLGFAAGLLGIGGGVLAVPLALILCRLPLRQCIGLSSATMMLTATVGAAIKIGTLGQHGFGPATALLIAAALAPTAILGGWFGARLTHKLPLEWVRGVFIILLLVAAWRMSGL